MKVMPVEISIKDIFNGYIDNEDEGAFAYSGKLTIRPAYQREFVYNIEQEKAVIDTVLKGFPLNIMYWVKIGMDTYEILDGQQRTLSIMHYLSHKYAIKYNDTQCYVDTLTNDVYEKLVNYKLMIYICEGTDSEKLEWFKIVNVAGEELTIQELRNSTYTGTWLTDAKRHFSKRNCAAKNLSDKYIKGDPNRQELLEKALKGICEFKEIKEENPIEIYMGQHKNDEDANELWLYFQDVIAWINKTFPSYAKDMQNVDWCHLYNKYYKNTYNSNKIDVEVKKLREDEDVIKSSGIYEYVLCKEKDPFAERLLSIREFSNREKEIAYNRQNGICPICKEQFNIDEMEGDHIIPWSKGGHTIQENCQMLCKECNRKKTDK